MDPERIRSLNRLQRRKGRKGVKHLVTKDLAIDSAAASIGAALGVVGGPVGVIVGAAVGAATADLIKSLSKREVRRISTVLELAAESVQQRVAEGASPRADIDVQDAETLVEAVLLKARQTFEATKLPLLANLLATAPFTGTPIVNMLATLSLVERLSYRQLCIISMIPGYDPHHLPPLSESTLGELFAKHRVGEVAEGILADLMDLIRQGLVVHVVDGVVQDGLPIGSLRIDQLRLAYPARLISNGARLQATIPPDDLKELREILAQQRIE
jgi:hypothetical protein